MKPNLAVVVLAGALLMNIAAGQEGVESQERMSAAAQAFAEARAACDRDGGALWGRPLWGPFMLVDTATRRFVGSEAIEAGTENATPTAPARIGEHVVHVGTLPPTFSVANTASNYADRQWAMATWPIPDTPEARRHLLCHELWHRIQADLGLALANPPCDHLDEEQGRLWMRLEMRALALALVARDDAGKFQAATDALVFRAHRHKLLASAAEAERKLELTEGLAEYTGLRLSDRADLAQWAAQNLESAQARDSLVRSFPYATGPAYGVLLDRADPDWRKGINAESDLAQLFAASLGTVALPEGDVLANAAERAMARYDGRTVRAEEHKRSEKRQARRQELTAKLVDGPVLELPMIDSRISFDPNTVALLPPHGTVYPAGTLTAAWGKLETAAAEVLIAQDWQKAFVAAAVPPVVSQDGSIVEGAGWILTLEPGWKLVRNAQNWRIAPAQ